VLPCEAAAAEEISALEISMIDQPL